MNLSKETIKIIQITDTHLFKDNSSILNINTKLMYENLLNNIYVDLCDTDAIFLTGDLSQDESKESYEIIADSLKNFNKKIYWIPGNHDSIENMHAVFDNKNHFVKGSWLTTHLWNFIFLNTKQDGKESGFLSDNELQFLQSKIKEEPNKPTAIVMHHHPIEVRTPLIDHYILENKTRFLEIINQSQINLIIFGHVHNDYSLRYDKIHLESSPATCFQFKKGAGELMIENKIGYKIYYFSSNSYVTKTRIFTH